MRETAGSSKASGVVDREVLGEEAHVVVGKGGLALEAGDARAETERSMWAASGHGHATAVKKGMAQRAMVATSILERGSTPRRLKTQCCRAP